MSRADLPPQVAASRRLRREQRTIRAMIQIYCRDHHKMASSLCDECQQLWQYATKRLDHCKFGPDKPTCATCPVHCYKPDMRQRVREVMRYSGPRMLLRHPILAIFHLIDGRRRVPPAPTTRSHEDH